MSEFKFYCFEDIIKFLELDNKFQFKYGEYPFNKNPEDIICSWGQILIPEKGIVDNASPKNQSLTELNMMYQIPFICENKTGIINQDISLSFRGDITNGIAEVCSFILDYGTKTNGFYIITDERIQLFFSTYIIPNQCNIGSMFISSTRCVNMGFIETKEDSNEKT